MFDFCPILEINAQQLLTTPTISGHTALQWQPRSYLLSSSWQRPLCTSSKPFDIGEHSVWSSSSERYGKQQLSPFESYLQETLRIKGPTMSLFF